MKRLQANNIKTVKTAEVGQDYDRFIIDAPCSGSGTWRRSPDAKFRLNEKKLLEIIDIQSSLLDLAAKKVKQGGRIVYITCSILEEENAQQITKFLNRNNDFSLVDMQTIWDKKIESPYPFADKNCLKFNPLTTGTDGFFIAVLERVK
jgi:16S rRNA (cytosine967-C5)-methyltransferase